MTDFNSVWFRSHNITPKVIFDVGCHNPMDLYNRIGNFTSSSTIHSFEADPDVFTKFNNNLPKNIVFNNLAVSDINGNIDFLKSDYIGNNSNKWDMSGSILDGNNEIALKKYGLCFGNKIQVNSITINEYCKIHDIQSIDLLHIDAQGAENIVISGIGNVDVKMIYAEVEDFDVYKTNMDKKKFVQLLHSMDFTPVETTSSDILFLNNKYNKHNFATHRQYFSNDYSNLINKFPGSDKISRNFSQAFQDMFVLSACNGKKNGTYLEIGGFDGTIINNTYLLESLYSWSGISVEIENDRCSAYNRKRINKCILADATMLNYNLLLGGLIFPKVIDYLQVDCEPASVTFDILQKILCSEYSFSVITFEHDCHKESNNIRNESRAFLDSRGYDLVVGNVCNSPGQPFEDWYMNRNLFAPSYISHFKRKSQTESSQITAQDYFLFNGI